jgi:hypothetical protein
MEEQKVLIELDRKTYEEVLELAEQSEGMSVSQILAAAVSVFKTAVAYAEEGDRSE